MKTKLTILFTVLGGAFATTVVFGQTTYVWTNQFPGHLAGVGDMNQATNWSPNGVPNPMTGPDANGVCGDLMQFVGLTTGPLSVTESGGTLGGGGGQSYPAGARIELTSAQTNSVTIYSVISISGGLRMNWFTIDPGAGPLIYGDHSANILDTVAGEQNGQVLGFTNNSTTPCVINETVRWREGGAGSHPSVFAGTGDWIVNNHLRSFDSSSLQVMMEGSGTLTWTGTNSFPEATGWYDKLSSPVRFDSGTTILKSSDLLNADTGSPNVVNNSLLVFDWTPAPGIVTTPDSIAGAISGTGPIQVNNGTITLAGASTFTGNINLTGGELIAGSVENVGVSGPLGQGGIISFNGGTLGWNLANAFDYSSRFDTSANQAYNLDTGGSSPTLATGLGSSGGTLTKLGGGTLTLAGANTYTGPTTVSAGELLFQGTKSGGGNITVADSADLGVVENGSQIAPNTLTLGTSTGVVLEFNNVTNHAAATLTPNNLVANAPVTIIVNSGLFFSIGETFPLLSWTSGTPPAVALGFLAGAGGHLVTNVSNLEIDLVIDNPLYVWTGASDLLWNTSSIDWTRSGNPVAWVNGNYALLDDTAGAHTNLAISGTITPTNATINCNVSSYVITNSAGNVLSGGGSLIKNGNGTLALPGGANSYTGVTTIAGGVLAANVLANGGSASDIGAAASGNTNIVLNGGTLQYTGPGVSIDRLFSVGQNGGTIDSEGAAALVLNNSSWLGMSGNGPRTLTLTGPNAFGDTIACGISNHPAGTTLAKSGAGTWILTGTNGYASGTVVNGGVLQVGATGGGGSGTLGSGNISIASGAGIDFQRTGILTVPGAISGGGSIINDGTGTVILANNNSFSGGLTINAGTLQIGNGGRSGSVNFSENIVNNSLLVFNTSGTFNYGAPGLISGTGNVIVQGGGFIKAIGANTYTGWTLIGSGTTFQPLEGLDGAIVSSVITNNGILRLVRQDATVIYGGPIVGSGKLQIGANNVNVGVITLTGVNTYTGGTFIGDNTLVLGDGVTPVSGSITGNVQFVNNFTVAQDNARTLEFNRPDNFTFGGTITTNFSTPQANMGIVQQNGLGTLTLTGTNNYAGGTIINAGTIQVGNGGTSGTIGNGPVTDNSLLVFNRSDSVTWSNLISGFGSFLKSGAGTLTFAATNSYSGNTTVSSGKLVFQGAKTGSGNITIADGAALGAIENGMQVTPNTLTLGSGSGCTLEFNNVTNITTAPLAANALSSAGTITVNINSGSGAKANYPLLTWSNGPAPTVSLGTLNGFVAGNLSISNQTVFLNVTTGVPTLNFTNTGNGLQFSWPGSFRLQAQTNSVSVGLGTNWANYSGGGTSPVTVPIGVTNGTVFFRLVSP